MLGISIDKIVIILAAAVFLLGPERLPGLASRAAQVIRRLRELADKTTEEVRRDLGDDYEQIDWRRLDPRQYDPRLIIRNALLDDSPPAPYGDRRDAGPATPAQDVGSGDEPTPPAASIAAGAATDVAGERPAGAA
ncbi:hypothetical protein [Microbacterium ulmi]|uniref:Sec-independent protein translocase protein TatB n=1 Tax=Microbacterium ulmi TaxID=179095 RepID=A0A7Y2LY66_9MICO|nr:hypothetical protein [Microbacterium ulmi]NII68477.1 sec-independent protein translocase protein TatB [Microbacterium ulmi]NNH03001.1 hypothetical protein [Microbacterium ulmi]